MSFAHPISAIIAATHTQFWYLPDVVREQERRRRCAYMRDYMRTYRKTAVPPLQISLSKAQRRRLKQAAADAGYKPTVFFREAAFAYLDRRIMLPKSLDAALAKATVEIDRIGNNIDQIAHRANIDRHATRHELERANQLLEQLQQTIDRIIPPFPRDYGD